MAVCFKATGTLDNMKIFILWMRNNDNSSKMTHTQPTTNGQEYSEAV